jgi:hypothetical protein
VRNGENRRIYLRSTRYRVLSWGGIGLLIAHFLFPQYGRRLLYGAVILSFLAMLPLFRLSELRNAKLDMRNKRDRTIVLFVAIGILALIVFSALYAAYATRR